MNTKSKSPSLNSELRVREAFVVLAFRLVVTQFLIGLAYFLLLELTGFDQTELGVGRLGLFSLLQGGQIFLSLYFFLRWFHRCYEITDKEVVTHSGVFTSHSEYYSLDRLESVQVKKNIWGMIFGFGTIKLTMYFSDHRDVVWIRNINNPKRQMKVLQDNLQNHSDGE